MSATEEVEPLRRDNVSAFAAAPQVGVASSPWVMVAAVSGALALGVLAFMTLNAGRLETAREDASPQPITPQPDYDAVPYDTGDSRYDRVVPDTDYPAQPFEALQPEGAAPAANPLSGDARLHSPALIVDLSAEQGSTGGPSPQAIAGAAAGDALSGNERFAARFQGAGQAAQARPLPNPEATIPQGTMIAAVLETAINSDLPGYVRALVSRDVRSFDGRNVLIPRGSRLIGQYRASSELGQSRAFVIWTRVIRPDGVSVDLNSPGTDSLGRGGLEGETDRHFFRRFGGAILLTLLGGAAEAVANDGGSDTQVVVGVARGGGDAASAALAEEINIPPTINVAQGAPVRIFVSRDLDFSAVSGRAP